MGRVNKGIEGTEEKISEPKIKQYKLQHRIK